MKGTEGSWKFYPRTCQQRISLVEKKDYKVDFLSQGPKRNHGQSSKVVCVCVSVWQAGNHFRKPQSGTISVKGLPLNPDKAKTTNCPCSLNHRLQQWMPWATSRLITCEKKPALCVYTDECVPSCRDQHQDQHEASDSAPSPQALHYPIDSVFLLYPEAPGETRERNKPFWSKVELWIS